MGSYLVVGGKENNTKSISYLMIDLMREILPEKKSLYDEIRFTITQEEVAKILYEITEMIDDEYALEVYANIHSEEYGTYDTFEKIKEDAEWVQRCFAKILSEMIICQKRKVFCEWE